MAGSLDASDDEEGQLRRQQYKAIKSEARSEFALSANQPQNAQSLKPSSHYQEFDTNVFEVNLDCVAKTGECATGDAEICNSCKGVFNKFSQLTKPLGDDK